MAESLCDSSNESIIIEKGTTHKVVKLFTGDSTYQGHDQQER